MKKSLLFSLIALTLVTGTLAWGGEVPVSQFPPDFEELLAKYVLVLNQGSPPYRMKEVLAEAESFEAKWRSQGQTAAAENTRRLLIAPTRAILAASERLSSCGLDSFSQSMRDSFSKSLLIDPCRTQIILSPGLQRLALSMEDMQGKLRSELPDVPQRDALGDSLLQMTREKLIEGYYAVKSRYIEPMPDASKAAAAFLGKKPETPPSPELLKTLSMLEVTQNRDPAQITQRRARLFQETRSSIEDLWKLGDASSPDFSRAQLLDAGLREWPKVLVQTPGSSERPQAFQIDPHSDQPGAPYLPYPYSNDSRIDWHPPSGPVMLRGTPQVIQSRYQQQDLQGSESALTAELTRAYPTEAGHAAEGLLRNLDQEALRQGWIDGNRALTEKGKNAPAEAWQSALDQSSSRAELWDPVFGTTTVKRLAGQRFLESYSRYKEGLARFATENPLSWNPEIQNAIHESPRRLPTDRDLNRNLSQYLEFTESLIRTTEKMAKSNPTHYIKSVMVKNPGLIKELVAEHPEFSAELCRVTVEMAHDHEREKQWDTFWTGVDIAVGVGAVVATGGWLVAGETARAVILTGRTVGFVGGVAMTHRGSTVLDMMHDAHTTEQYLYAMGAGTPEDLDAQWKQVHENAWSLVGEGLLTATGSLSVTKNLKNTDLLKFAAGSKENFLELARRLDVVGEKTTKLVGADQVYEKAKNGVRAYGEGIGNEIRVYGKAIENEGWQRSVVRDLTEAEKQDKALGLLKPYEEATDHSFSWVKSARTKTAETVGKLPALEGQPHTVHPREFGWRTIEYLPLGRKSKTLTAPVRAIGDATVTAPLFYGAFKWWEKRRNTQSTEHNFAAEAVTHLKEDPLYWNIRASRDLSESDKLKEARKQLDAIDFYSHITTNTTLAKQASKTEINQSLLRDERTQILFTRVHDAMQDLSLPDLKSGHLVTQDWTKTTLVEKLDLQNRLMDTEHERIFTLTKVQDWFPEPGRKARIATNSTEQSRYAALSGNPVIQELKHKRDQGQISHAAFMEGVIQTVEWDSTLEHYRILGRPLQKIVDGHLTPNEMSLDDIQRHLILPQVENRQP